jgi:multicomponent Na+:H+ antiporter subunit C
VFVFLAGLYGIVTSRDLIQITVCVSVCQSATYILLLAIGYREHATAPVNGGKPSRRKIAQHLDAPRKMTDMGGADAVSSLLLALALRVYDASHSLDPSHIVGQRG